MEFKEMIDACKKYTGTRHLGPEIKCGMVGASLLTKDGNLYTGICLNNHCSIGYCAERQAAGEMIKMGETQVVKMVAIDDSFAVLPPCGVCREFIMQINSKNAECEVMYLDGKVDKLKNLLPHYWMDLFFEDRK